MDGVPHDDLPDGKVSVDPTGGPQGPYFDAPFEDVDSDNDGLITWQQLCRSNPHIWLEDEKRVDFVDMFGHLDVKINKKQMHEYIERLKSDLPTKSKYGRNWKRGSRKSRSFNWSDPRVIKHRKNMPWNQRFNVDQGFINYHAIPVFILKQFLRDQGLITAGSKQQLIERLIGARREDTIKAEKAWVELGPKNYMINSEANNNIYS